MLGFRLFWLTGDRLAQLLQRHTNLGIRHADLLNKYTATLVDIAETLHCWDRDCQQTSMSESGHSRQERTSANARVYEYTPASVMGPLMSTVPRSSRRRAHASVRGRRLGRHTMLSEGAVSLSSPSYSPKLG